jgi:hypothetical protein
VAAERVTHIETDLESAAVGNRALSARIEASQMLTFRLTEQPRRVDKRPAAAGSAGR